MTNLEPGYYTDELGQTRYWDGSQWLTPKQSESSPDHGNFLKTNGSVKVASRARTNRIFLIGALVLGGAILLSILVKSYVVEIPISQNPNSGVVQNNDKYSGETLGQTNARKKAEQYLQTMPFSQNGLVKQLAFEGFSETDANYAVGILAVDWNEQAAKKAKQYLDMMSFSRDGLIRQLEFEGFSPVQAQFGVKAVGY